jgi:hypothetical protein
MRRLVFNLFYSVCSSSPDRCRCAPIEQKARAAGCLGTTPVGDDRKFRSARQRLGIVAYQRDRRWWWKLPDVQAVTPTPGEQRTAPPEGLTVIPEPSREADPHAARLLDDDEKGVAITDTLGGPLEITEQPPHQQPDPPIKPREPDTPIQTGKPDLPDQALIEVSTNGRRTIAEEPREVDQAAAQVVAWANAIANLDRCVPPAGVPEIRWKAFCDNAGDFAESPLASRAALLGWSSADLFGFDPRRFMERHDRLGLIWKCVGGRVVQIDHGAPSSPRASASATARGAASIRRLSAYHGRSIAPSRGRGDRHCVQKPAQIRTPTDLRPRCVLAHFSQ